MDLKIVESPALETGTAAILLSPADYVAYKEYLEKRKELEENLGVVTKVTSILEDSFFIAKVEPKKET